ncbi:MAG: Ig-like domain-containing protein [candidate division KSB1 bacterium]|nr:Ig-like domain-containing protein [candidate division KSB1 bacterium]MDZ7304045.1 Ig-like domain-containing protein [candidate division KSB1 bacterium]MDZ7313244.1 Ig-like domain-containing protein [candidate division KSB1 bacterium]
MLFPQMKKWRKHARFMRLVQLPVLALLSLLFSLSVASAQTPVFINEIHYDNTGTDAGEAIEIAGPAGTDLTGWSIVLYNGNGGAVYDTDVLSGTIPNLCNGFGVIVLNYPTNGIQNGSPDGIALVNPSNTVIQFLSYEGSFTAVGGPANGMVSTDIGVSEAGTDPLGLSLQLSGTGQFYEDFTWKTPAASTFGACNTGQNFVSGDAAPFVVTTTPANNATNVAVNTNITITFSEAVNVSGSWFSISGSSSGSHTATASGGSVTFTLDPDVDFSDNESVTVTVFAANITDQDDNDPPDTMATDYTFKFATPSHIIHEIFEIQGSGLASPFANQTITTENNVVTAVSANGFFIQTPAARSDNDPQTSDGIFVFTGSTPEVKAGDLVDVTGEVMEFFNFTEFSNTPTVKVVSSGNPLPPPIQFDSMTPSPNQPQAATEYERFEGMLVHVANGVVAAPNQTFGSDPIAEVLIVAGPNRPFRESGIKYPGLAGLPVWDGNPEIFEFDPDRLGQPNMAIPAGSTFSATGVLGFEFGGYELWPTSYSVNAATLPRAVRPRQPGESTIATLNLYQLYDDIDDPGIEEPVRTPQQYADKLNKLSLYIRTLLGAPDILAVQEAEKLQVLQDLANKINSDDVTLTYMPYLIEGNDVSGIDVGFLVRAGVTVNSIMQLGATELLTFDNTLLHDRPPLLLNAKLADSSAVSVLAVHLRSLNGIDDPSEGPRVRQKRHEQAVSVSNMVQSLQTIDPNIHLVVAGDFNAFQFSDGYVHVLGQVMGTPAPASEALIPGTDNVNPDLINATISLPANEQYSFVLEGSAQMIDHILISQALQSSVTGIQFARGNSDAAENFETDGTTALRASDHDGLVLFVKSPPPAAVASRNQLSVTRYQLEQNFPNPFSPFTQATPAGVAFGNPNTMISFALPEAGRVAVNIYAENGQLVRTLVDREMAAGWHQWQWNGRNESGQTMAAGVYLYRIVVQGKDGHTTFTETRRMTLLK